MDEFRGLSSANISTLITIKKLFCIPSLISCIFLLLLFWFFKEIRGITIENVIYFTLSEIIYSIALLFPYQEHSYTNTCQVQSFLINFCIQSRNIWAIIISYSCLTNSIKSDYLERNKKFFRKSFISFALIIPLSLTIYSSIQGIHGNAGVYCWLDLQTLDRRKFIIKNEIAFLFINLSETVLLIYLSVKTFKLLNALSKKNKKKLSDNEHFKYYPIIVLHSSLWRLFNSLVNITTYNSFSFILMFIQILLESATGLLVFIVFILSPGLRHSLNTLYVNISQRQWERPSVFLSQNDINESNTGLYPRSTVGFDSRASSFSQNSISSIEDDDDDDGELKEVN